MSQLVKCLIERRSDGTYLSLIETADMVATQIHGTEEAACTAQSVILKAAADEHKCAVMRMCKAAGMRMRAK